MGPVKPTGWNVTDMVLPDGHAGADLYDYKPYLASRWHDEFDAWAPTYVNPYADLQAPTAYRSWDSARRLEETEIGRAHV